MQKTIKRAILSVSNKDGLLPLAKFLAEQDIEILSTGGTAKHLKEGGVPVKEVSDHTGFPEILGGRVKTLHPKIHGGILFKRDNMDDSTMVQKLEIAPIDLLVVNLYPFEETVASGKCTDEEIIEQIDIGGPTMLRSSAKNHAYVTVLSDPADYEGFMEAFSAGGGSVPAEFNRRMARKVYERTAQYDAAIARYFAGDLLPSRMTLGGQKLLDLRYGENPHQKAALYLDPLAASPNVASAKQLHGKELSYNNLLDLNAALNLVAEFPDPSLCFIKHNNACGLGSADTLTKALRRALEGDRQSAYGAIVAANREVGEAEAAELIEEATFVEAILAPGFSDEAVEMLTTQPSWKKNVRLLACGPFSDEAPANRSLRTIKGGFLVQEEDTVNSDDFDWKVVSQTPLPDALTEELKFAIRCVKHLKSNAIAVTHNHTLLGAGAGQVSRVDAVQQALTKAGNRAQGAILASDAFFPFRDGVEEAAQAGIAAIVQPGGSINDEEVIEAANAHDIIMVFTGKRHFNH